MLHADSSRHYLLASWDEQQQQATPLQARSSPQFRPSHRKFQAYASDHNRSASSLTAGAHPICKNARARTHNKLINLRTSSATLFMNDWWWLTTSQALLCKLACFKLASSSTLPTSDAEPSAHGRQLTRRTPGRLVFRLVTPARSRLLKARFDFRSLLRRPAPCLPCPA